MTLEEFIEKLENRKNNITIIKSGIGPLSLLGVALIVLKAIGYITWSWWWVLAPFWIPAIISIVLLLCFFVGLIYVASETDVKLGNVLKEESISNSSNKITEKDTLEENKEKPKRRSARSKKSKSEANDTELKDENA